MAERESPFADEWRDCLREHYKHVVREKDTSTEDTLRPILEQVGFREDELSELKVLADPSAYDAQAAQTLRNGSGTSAADDLTFKVHPAECTCAACMDTVLDAGHDDDGQPLEFPEEPDEGAGNVFQVVEITEADETTEAESVDSDVTEPETDPDDSDDDNPKQRSLF